MARKTPQQKKQESYKKDRRNTRGESGSRSRYSVARRKRNRSSRARAASRQIEGAARLDPELAERLEGKAVVRFGGRWQKIPDEPLGVVLNNKLGRRLKTGSIPEPVARKKQKRIKDTKRHR